MLLAHLVDIILHNNGLPPPPHWFTQMISCWWWLQREMISTRHACTCSNITQSKKGILHTILSRQCHIVLPFKGCTLYGCVLEVAKCPFYKVQKLIETFISIYQAINWFISHNLFPNSTAKGLFCPVLYGRKARLFLNYTAKSLDFPCMYYMAERLDSYSSPSWNLQQKGSPFPVVYSTFYWITHQKGLLFQVL